MTARAVQAKPVGILGLQIDVVMSGGHAGTHFATRFEVTPTSGNFENTSRDRHPRPFKAPINSLRRELIANMVFKSC